MPEHDDTRTGGTDFIRAIIEADLDEGRHASIVTRFPPEPNGYLHIGHAKSICLNFGVAGEYGGVCNLRFDDTNPETEDMKYVESIQEDVRWLGFDWDDRLYFASDYFERLYEHAEELIRKGLAYVDSQTTEQIRERRGTVTEAGTPSPYRERSVEENLELFRRMRDGEFDDGEHVLRAKIDMAASNMIMRDPVLYRIRHAEHYRAGDEWCIYPMYDYAHPLSDAYECVTHSLCTLEFENNREIYDWLVENIELDCRPHQYEFARLNLDYTIMSKRKLLRLVQEGHVDGWDDPRMPTIAGLSRRGVTPAAIRAFSEMVGVAKADSRVDIGKLEYQIRDDLNRRAPRVMCVLDPLRVVIENWPEGKVDRLDTPSFPHDVGREGSRPVPFSGTLYIERDDFREDPPDGFRRLAPGREVRLRHAYLITCTEVLKDEGGRIVELRCTYDPETRGGSAPDGRKVSGTLHWVSAAHSLPAEVRLYDRLFRVPEPEADPEKDFTELLNPESLVTVHDARIEPSVRDAPAGTRYQFERTGYFISDPHDSTPGALVFNRTVTLRDTWARQQAQRKAEAGEAPRPTEPGRPERSRPAGGERTEPTDRVEPRRRVIEPPADPELAAKFQHYRDEIGLDDEDARILADDAHTAAFFEAALETYSAARSVANWVINELPRELEDRELADLPFGGGRFGELVRMVDHDVVSSNVARDVLAVMAESGGEPGAIVEEKGLTQIDDPAELGTILDRLLSDNPDKVARYRDGQTGLLGFFIGGVMRETDGRANPELVKELARERLEG